MRSHQAGFFLQVEAQTAPWNEGTVLNLLPKRITRRRPTKVAPGIVVVEVTLDLPDMLFVPTIQVSAEAVE